MESSEEAKLQHFLQWLQVNEVELRGCEIKYTDSNKGFGIFFADEVDDGMLLVVPLHLAITPMRILQDPLLGPECRAMSEEGPLDDRLLIVLFLMVERLRRNSTWKPYLDMLPTTFGSPHWYSEDEFLELKGTSLYRATELQMKGLWSLYNEKVKRLVEKLSIVDDLESETSFHDFLWANSVFWSRAQNIPFPRSYMFPVVPEEHSSFESKSRDKNKGDEGESLVEGVSSALQDEDTVWIEGLVPGIDFCNHGNPFILSSADLKALATWEVDGTGSATGVPFSMYLLSAGEQWFQSRKEISISYGNKGNEELLHLYGFVINDNPDDYLMVNYPEEAIQNISFSEQKSLILEAQKAELRCLLPRGLLNDGFFPPNVPRGETSEKYKSSQISGFSWSGQRKIPSYINKLVFPDNFLTALRTIAMREDELFQVASLLEEVVGTERVRQPSDTEVRAAIWEACGDSGALQVLVDLLNLKLMGLEDGSGTEESDTELLKKAQYAESSRESSRDCNSPEDNGSISTTHSGLLSRKKWCSIVYRRGQKELTRLFLREAEHALQLALEEGN